jgi:hypothetical protein
VSSEQLSPESRNASLSPDVMYQVICMKVCYCSGIVFVQRLRRRRAIMTTKITPKQACIVWIASANGAIKD